MAEYLGTRGDLTDCQLPRADHTWFTDGSSFFKEGEHKVGVAVVDGQTTIWAWALPPETSPQKAELIALTKALELAKGQKVNIYTDSRYAFVTAHVHREIYKRRGLLTSAGKEIKNKTEILALLRALFLPKKVNIIHCPGHQKGDDPIVKGDWMADEMAKKAVLNSEILSLEEAPPSTEDYFQYSAQDLETIQKLNVDFEEQKKKSLEISGQNRVTQERCL